MHITNRVNFSTFFRATIEFDRFLLRLELFDRRQRTGIVLNVKIFSKKKFILDL